MTAKLPNQLLKINHSFEPQEPEDSNIISNFDINLHIILNPAILNLKIINSDQNKNIQIPRTKLAELLRRNGRVDAYVLHLWLSILCDYHNRHSAKQDGLPRYILFDGECFESMERETPGYMYLTRELMKKSAPLRSRSECRADLINMNVEHILIPVERDINGATTTTKSQDTDEGSSMGVHHGLVVVSFRTKVVEYFDSLHLDGRRFVFLVLEWLKYELHNSFKLQDWSWRQSHCPHQAPAALDLDLDLEDTNQNYNNSPQSPSSHRPDQVRYPNGIDGGVHVAMNAWNCLFGFYSPTHYALFDNHAAIWAKRRRMVVDILRGELLFNPVESAKGWHQPQMEINSYLGLIRKGENWERRFLGYAWDSSALPHRVGLEKVSLVEFYRLISKLQRRELVVKRPRIGDLWNRWRLLVEMAGKIARWEGLGEEEGRFGEGDEWTVGMLKCFVMGWIDGQRGGFEDDLDWGPEKGLAEQYERERRSEGKIEGEIEISSKGTEKGTGHVKAEMIEEEDDLYSAD